MRAPPWGPSPAREKGRGGGGESLHVSRLERRIQTRVTGGVPTHGNLYGSEGSTRSCPDHPSCHSLPRSQLGWGLLGSEGDRVFLPWRTGWCGAAPPPASLPEAVLEKESGLAGARVAAAARGPAVL